SDPQPRHPRQPSLVDPPRHAFVPLDRFAFSHRDVEMFPLCGVDSDQERAGGCLDVELAHSCAGARRSRPGSSQSELDTDLGHTSCTSILELVLVVPGRDVPRATYGYEVTLRLVRVRDLGI